MSNEIEVPEQVIVDLEKVRQSGKYNMFSATEVVFELNRLGKYNSFLWLVNRESVRVNHKRYMAALEELGNVKSLIDEF